MGGIGPPSFWLLLPPMTAGKVTAGLSGPRVRLTRFTRLRHKEERRPIHLPSSKDYIVNESVPKIITNDTIFFS